MMLLLWNDRTMTSFAFILFVIGVGGVIAVLLSQPLHLQFLCSQEEGVEVILSDIDLAVVDEVDDILEVVCTDAPEVEQRVVVRVAGEDVPEQRAGGGEDHLVGGHLVAAAHQHHVEQDLVLAQLPQRAADVRVKIIPPQTEFICTHFEFQQ